MDVFKPAPQDRPSPGACVCASEEAEETDVFRWPTPKNGIGGGAEPEPPPQGVWTAVFDYEATADDELSLRKGDLVEVLSKDSLVSGDEGWWTGVIAERVGIFPSNYVISGVQEGMRDTAVPPPHREYSIVPRPWEQLGQTAVSRRVRVRVRPQDHCRPASMLRLQCSCSLSRRRGKEERR